MAELVDALDSGSNKETCGGSSPLSRTKIDSYESFFLNEIYRKKLK